ncbi:MAG: ACP S-malonyltransferase [Oligoflexales bacterium]
MASYLMMFPGQGSQSVGMGSKLFADFPNTKLVFEEAEDAIRHPIRKLCLNGPKEDLELTANQQPCILTLSVAIWNVIKEECAAGNAKLFAGHSLGEFSALVASGKLDFSKAVQLVHKRGQAMQEAVPKGKGAMAAVIGLNPEELIKLCSVTSEKLGKTVEVVNFNSPAQQIISGDKIAVEQVCESLSKDSIRTIPLPVSAPFHSSLMKPARLKMSPLLENTLFHAGRGQVIANLTGKIEDPYNANLLISQIDKPVLWTKTMESAHNKDAQVFVETGPGKVLFGLARRCLPKGTKIFHSEDLKQTLVKLNSL